MFWSRASVAKSAEARYLDDLLAFWQGDRQHCAARIGIRRRQGAVVGGNDAVGNGQAEAGAAGCAVAGRVATEEGREEVRDVVRRKAGACVLDRDRD